MLELPSTITPDVVWRMVERASFEGGGGKQQRISEARMRKLLAGRGQRALLKALGL